MLAPQGAPRDATKKTGILEQILIEDLSFRKPLHFRSFTIFFGLFVTILTSVGPGKMIPTVSIEKWSEGVW